MKVILRFYKEIKLGFYLLLVAGFMAGVQPQRPTLYLIGDSTVRNGSGAGSNGQWGWGSFRW